MGALTGHSFAAVVWVVLRFHSPSGTLAEPSNINPSGAKLALPVVEFLFWRQTSVSNIGNLGLCSRCQHRQLDQKLNGRDRLETDFRP